MKNAVDKAFSQPKLHPELLESEFIALIDNLDSEYIRLLNWFIKADTDLPTIYHAQETIGDETNIPETRICNMTTLLHQVGLVHKENRGYMRTCVYTIHPNFLLDSMRRVLNGILPALNKLSLKEKLSWKLICSIFQSVEKQTILSKTKNQETHQGGEDGFEASLVSNNVCDTYFTSVNDPTWDQNTYIDNIVYY